MKELLTEFLSNILEEERVVRKPGSTWQTPGGKWSGKRRDGTTQSGFASEEAAKKWVNGGKKSAAPEKTDGEVPATKETEPQDSDSIEKTGDEKPTSSEDDEVLGLSNKARIAGLEKIHTKFFELLRSNDSAALTAFIQEHGIVFDERKNTFYVMSVKGREQKKIFGDGSKSSKGIRQRRLFDRLREMGVDVGTRASYVDPLKPAGIVPPEQRVPFNATKDGNVIIFGDVRYEFIPDNQFGAHVAQRREEWINNFIKVNGRRPTREERDQATLQITIFCDAMNKRYKLLEKLMQRSTKDRSPHTVAVYDGAQGVSQYIENMQRSLLAKIPPGDSDLAPQVETLLKDVNTATTEEDTLIAIRALYEFIEKTKVFSETSASSLAESMSILLELKRGRQVIVPMSDNFKAADLITLDNNPEVDPTTMSLEQLADRVRVIYSSVSVKRDVGAASSMLEKWMLCTFYPDGAKTRERLKVLSSGHPALFSDDTETRTRRQNEIKNAVIGCLKDIAAYFNIQDLPEDRNAAFAMLLNLLGNGGVECVDGRTVARSMPRYMQGQDVEAYQYTQLAQLAAEAHGNTRVIAQGFGNHFWGGSRGFFEVDGINQQVKQVSEPNKSQRLRTPRGSKTTKQMPDYIVSHNVPVESKEDLRTGDPCK